MSKLTHVLQPIRIAGVDIPNRIVRPAHGTGLTAMGNVTERLIEYHETRARGGVGLTIIEIMGIHPSGPGSLLAFLPDLEETYPRLTDRLHEAGTKVFQQLWHAGHNVMPLDGGPPWAPSDTPNLGALGSNSVVPIAMTRSMISEIIEAYVTAALNCERWGADGVEIHCAHGYLPAQFLSPAINKREDEYGGSFENRARFMLEVIEAVRRSVSKEFAVGIRVSSDVIVNGVQPEDVLQASKMAEDRGICDFFNVSQGNYQTLRKIIGGMHEPMGYELPTSLPITRNLKTPTIVVGRMRTLEEADQLIRNGDCDMVAMNRAILADPDLVKKSAEGHPERVRPCIGCNQGCIGGELGPDGIGCAVNAGAGREGRLGDAVLRQAEKAKKILVVGGGPAGLEAARVAALRGHKVTLAEARPHLGGTLNLAAMAPTRAGFLDIVTWLQAEVYRLGVVVKLSTYMDIDDIEAEAADSVIIATGAAPRLDGVQVSNPGEPIEGMDQPHVLSSNSLFEGEYNELGQTAVVIDDTGHYEGVATAEFLVSKGLDVTYVTRHISFAARTEPFLMTEAALQRLGKGSFKQRLRTRALSIGLDSITVAPTYEEAGSNVAETIPADTVIFISLNRPERKLYDDLVARGRDATLVGDASTPRFLTFATRDGHVAGANV